MSTSNKHIIEAINLARANVEQFEIEEGWYYISRREPIPTKIQDKLYDFLEEYGDDNDLPENWWAEYCDLEDFFMEL